MQQKQCILYDKIVRYYVSPSLNKQQPVVLFLHGRQDSATTFSALTKLYDDHDIQWLAVDFPGFGGSDLCNTDWGVKDYSLWLKDLLDVLGLSFSTIIGHSFGCRVALVGIHEQLLSPRKLVLISAGGIQEKVGGWKLGLMKGVKKMLQILRMKSLLMYIQSKIRSDDYQHAGKLSTIFLNVIGEDLQYTFSSIHTPTVIIRGQRDDIVPVRHAYIFHTGIVDSVLHVLPGTHFVHQELPEKIYSLINHG